MGSSACSRPCTTLTHPKDPHELEEETYKNVFLLLQGLHHSFGDLWGWGRGPAEGESPSWVTLRLRLLAWLPALPALSARGPEGPGSSSSGVLHQPRHTYHGWHGLLGPL